MHLKMLHRRRKPGFGRPQPTAAAEDRGATLDTCEVVQSVGRFDLEDGNIVLDFPLINKSFNLLLQ
jgi:hypothetical protein